MDRPSPSRAGHISPPTPSMTLPRPEPRPDYARCRSSIYYPVTVCRSTLDRCGNQRCSSPDDHYVRQDLIDLESLDPRHVTHVRDMGPYPDARPDSIPADPDRIRSNDFAGPTSISSAAFAEPQRIPERL